MYQYISDTILLKEDFERYDETLDELLSGLEEQSDPYDISPQEVLDDENIGVSESVFEGDTTIEPLDRYRIDGSDEDRSVYVFDHPLGIEVVGDYAMIRYAMPDYVPDSVIPMQETKDSQ